MSAELVIGNGLELDDGVTLGYRPSRSAATVLTLGAGARLRSGTVTYARSKIGRHFETGHHVVIREGASIGTAVSVWSNTVVDYGCVIGVNATILPYATIEPAPSSARVRWSLETSPREWWPMATLPSRAATSRSSRASRPACARPTRPVWRRRRNRRPPRTTTDNR
jgi:hypothetical protein